MATQYLSSAKSLELEDVKGILERSAQKLPNDLISNYSMAVNLKTGTIHLYYKTDFSTVAIISLHEELQKGKHHSSIASYFPEPVVPLLEHELAQGGISSVVDTYRTLRTRYPGKYNFTNADALNLCVNWIEMGKTDNAIELLRCLLEFDLRNANLYSWLGVACRKANSIDESERSFATALAIDPGNYIATLFGKQLNRTVTFRLADFEGAEHVSLMGEFTGWARNPVPMKKEAGFWTCKIILSPGPVIYKFLVNDQYLADGMNTMHIGTGPDIYSKLYVW